MITLNVIIEVRKLFNQGISQRRIAKIVGISRNSIQKILKGPMPCELIEIDDVCELCGKELPCISCARKLNKVTRNREEITRDEENQILKPMTGIPRPRLEGV